MVSPRFGIHTAPQPMGMNRSRSFTGTEWSTHTSVHDDIIISPPIKIFMVFIFAVAALSAKTMKFCTMRKFPIIRYTLKRETYKYCHIQTKCTLESRMCKKCSLGTKCMFESGICKKCSIQYKMYARE